MQQMLFHSVVRIIPNDIITNNIRRCFVYSGPPLAIARVWEKISSTKYIVQMEQRVK